MCVREILFIFIIIIIFIVLENPIKSLPLATMHTRTNSTQITLEKGVHRGGGNCRQTLPKPTTVAVIPSQVVGMSERDSCVVEDRETGQVRLGWVDYRRQVLRIRDRDSR